VGGEWWCALGKGGGLSSSKAVESESGCKEVGAMACAEAWEGDEQQKVWDQW